MKKLLALLAILVLVAGGVWFWQRLTPGQITVRQQNEPMKIARYYWPGMYWVDIADAKGFFEEEDLAVELIDANQDYQQSLTDTVIGKIDVNSFSLLDIMNFKLKGANLVAVIAADNSRGSEGIVAKNPYTSLQDLKGKKVGVAKGTYLEYTLDYALQQNGIKPSDIIKVDIPAERTVEPFSNGELAGAVAWEPILTELESTGGEKVYDTTQSPGLLYFVYAFDKSFIDSRPEDVRKFLRVWKKTLAFMESNPSESYQIIANTYGVSPEEVEAFTKQDKILSLAENVEAFQKSNAITSLYGSADNINDFLKVNGLTKESIDPATFLDDRFILELVEQ